MARSIPILNVVQSGATPGSFTIGAMPENASGDWTQVFQGQFYRNSVGATQPFYTSPIPPSGYVLIQATQFQVVQNASFSGTYTVYTTPSVGGLASSTFAGGQTTVLVNEPVPAPTSPGDVSTGFITNVSTYYIVVQQGSPVIVPPAVNLTGLPVDFVGRNFSGYGEVFTQNFVASMQNFAGPSAPGAPFPGMLWYNTTTSFLMVWTGTAWQLVNNSAFGSALPYRFTQSVAASTWSISHGLGAAAPYIVDAQFFVDTGGGVKPIIPSDVTYVDANDMTVTFTGPYTGYAIVRL